MTYQPSREPSVKDALRDALNLHPDRIDHFPVTNNGRGVGGVPDRCGTVKLEMAAMFQGYLMGQPEAAIWTGVAFRIECKGYDATKKADPSALQLRSLEGNARMGGFSAVARPSVQTIYFSDGTNTDMVMSPAELVEYMLSGEWVR